MRKILSALILSSLISLCPSCYDSYGVGELKLQKEEYIAAKEHRLKLIEQAKKGIADVKPAYESTMGMEAKLLEIQANNTTYRKEIEELEVELREEISIIKACQESFKIRVLVETGTKYETLRLRDGNTLTGVTYKGMKDGKATLSHSAGYGLYALTQLPVELAKYVILPPAKPISAVDPELLLARKPDILKTREKINRDQQAKYTKEREQKAIENAQYEKERRLRSEKMTAERAAQRSAYDNKIRIQRGLTKKISDLNKTLLAHRDKVEEADLAYEKAKFRQSKADRQSSVDTNKAREQSLLKQISDAKAQLEALFAK